MATSNFIIATTCMNRSNYLLKSLPSWLSLKVPIVIIDWSSKTPIKIDDPSVHVIRVDNKTTYDTSRSKNLSFRICQKLYPSIKYVLSIDCDVEIDELFEINPKPNTVYRNDISFENEPNHKPDGKIHNPDYWGKYGTFLTSFECLNRVNGFDERLSGYAGIDIDLYERLARIGVKTEFLKYDHLIHQTHDGRFDNYSIKSGPRSSRANNKIKWKKLWDHTFKQDDVVI